MSYVLESFSRSLFLYAFKSFQFFNQIAQTLTVKLAHIPVKYLFHPLKLRSFVKWKEKGKEEEEGAKAQSNAVYHEAQENETKISDGEIQRKYRHMATLLLIYCRNTFIIAVENRKKVEREK